MNPATTESPAKEAAEQQNLFVLATHHILLRLAWIFKTESVIIPAFLDLIAGSGWIRGFLPVLNRIGQSLPPLLSSASLRNSCRKTPWLMTTTSVMGGLFAILAVACLKLETLPADWLPFLFLFLYAIFFAATGVNQLSYNTLQGKLIPAGRRGRLMSIGGMGGSAVAMTAAFLLLPRWLAWPQGTGFAAIFGFTAAMFFCSSLMLFAIREQPGKRGKQQSHPVVLLQNVWRTLSNHQQLRKTGLVTCLFMSSMALFPHYQWLGRVKLECSGTDLMWWVIVQNAAVGLFSWMAGHFGDRYGYRIVLRFQLFAAACIPLVAIGLANGLNPATRGWYVVTFFLLGLTPVIIKTFFNYALELAEEDQHPHFLSTLSLCMAVPVFLSPGLGWLLDRLPLLVFLLVSILVFIAAWGTFRLIEPRHQLNRDELT